MEQGRDSHTARPHEAIERDAYAAFDRPAEGIELSDTDQARVDRAVRSVSKNGYAIVTGFLDGERTRRAHEDLAPVFDLPDDLVIKGRRLPAGGGENTIHVCNLFARSRAADGIAIDPLLLKVIDGVLGPAFQLSVACAMRPGPGAVNQVLHRDDVMYGVPRPHFPVVANTLIALDDFTRENGATRVVPGSHRSVEPVDQDAAAVDAEMPAGSLLVWDGAVWHGSGANRTREPVSHLHQPELQPELAAPAGEPVPRHPPRGDRRPPGAAAAPAGLQPQPVRGRKPHLLPGLLRPTLHVAPASLSAASMEVSLYTPLYRSRWRSSSRATNGACRSR